MPPPASYSQWVHQTYVQRWKGTVDVSTVPGEDHAPKRPHWIATLSARGAAGDAARGARGAAHARTRALAAPTLCPPAATAARAHPRAQAAWC